MYNNTHAYVIIGLRYEIGEKKKIIIKNSTYPRRYFILFIDNINITIGGGGSIAGVQS